MPSPLPMSTVAVSSPWLAVTISTLPSPLKSAAATPRGVAAGREGFLRLERAVAVAQQHAHRVVAPVGGDDVGDAVAGQVGHRHASRGRSRRGRPSAGSKVPLPLPSSTLTLLSTALATTRSGLPSPFKSTTLTE